MKWKSSLEFKMNGIYLRLMEEGFKNTWKSLEEEWEWCLLPSWSACEREEEWPSFVSFWSLNKTCRRSLALSIELLCNIYLMTKFDTLNDIQYQMWGASLLKFLLKKVKVEFCQKWIFLLYLLSITRN